MNKIVAAAIGLLVASIVPILVATAAELIIRGWSPTLLPGALLAYQFSAFATGVFGLPAFLLFWRYGLIRWWSSIAVGAAIGALVTLIFGLSVYGDMARDVLFFSLTGAVSAFAFWLIWSCGRNEPKER